MLQTRRTRWPAKGEMPSKDMDGYEVPTEESRELLHANIVTFSRKYSAPEIARLVDMPIEYVENVLADYEVERLA